MSLYNALGDSHQQGNLSWNHSAGFSQTSGAFTNCTPVREQQPLGSSVQPQSQILSSLLSAPSSCNQYVPFQETQASKKEENGLLLDEPGMVIGREEVILTDNNPVASSGYPTSAIQNQQILPSHIHSAYNHTTGHGQFLQGSVGSSTPQEFVTHPSQSIGSYGQDSYSSASHLQGLQRNQPVYVVQQQGVNQESPGGPLQQNQILGQQQGGASQQALSMQQHSHLQRQPQSQAQLSAVSQLPQHNQTGQQQQTSMPHPLGQTQLHQQVTGLQHYHNLSQPTMGHPNQQLTQAVGQQHGVSQQSLSQQQVPNHHRQLIHPLPNVQTNPVDYNMVSRPLTLQNFVPVSSANHSFSLPGNNVRFLGGRNTFVINNNQVQHPMGAVVVKHLQSVQNQLYNLQNQMTVPNQQTFHGQRFQNPRSLLGLPQNSQLLFQSQQPVHSQQAMPSQLSLPNHQPSVQTQQALQQQASFQPQHSVQNHQATGQREVGDQHPSNGSGAGYSGQLHGQVMGMDQQQQQQTAYPQQQQQQANNMKQGQPRMLFLVQPNSVSGNHYVTSHHSSQHLPAQQLPQNAIQTAMGSPLASSLPNSPQLNPQVPSKGAMNSSPQMSVQKSPQLSLQSSPQMSVQSSPQPLSLQGSPSTSQNSGQMAMMPSTPSKQQLSGQDASQLGNLSQLNNASQAPTPQQAVQNVSQVVQLQNANHLPKTTHLPYTPQPSGSVMPQQSFQVYQQVPVNQQGINQFLGQKQDAPVRGSGRGRGRGRGQSKGSRGGRGRGRGRGNANHSTTGLHMAPDHFRPDMGFTVPLETPASDMEPAVSHAESSMQSQEASMQELSMPVVKSEPNNGSLLQGSNVPCLASYSTPIQQTFATKEVWPTPMPPPKQEQCDSPPALIVNTTPQSSHQPNISPALSPTSFLEDIKVSPPATPVPVVSAAEVVSPPAQAPALAQAQAPGQLAAPVAPESAEEKPKPMPIKRQLPNDGEGRAVCKYCGYCSTNLETCEGCSRAFPPDTKVIPVKKQETAEADNEREQRTCGGGKVNSTPAIAGPSASKKALYGNKLQAPEAGLATNTSYAAPNNLAGQTPTRGSYTRRRGSGAGRGSYRRKLKEPVTLTISSDDDDDPSSDTSRLSVSTITTPAASQDEEDGIFSPNASGSKPNSFGMSRRFRMQDASGQIVRPTEGLFFDARGVRVGTMRTTGIDVRFRAQRIVFKVISDTTKRELEFFIFVTDLTWIKFCFSQPQPVFFLRVNAECGQRLRTQLKMSLDSVETFDPSCQDDKKNMVVVIVDKKVTDETGMREILKLYNKVQNVASFLQEVDSDTCNELLVKSSPGSLEQVATIGYSRIKVLQLYPGQAVSDRGDQGGELGQNEENSPASMSGDMSDANDNRNSQDGSDTPSPTSGFIGPEEKLLIYPFPPTKGSITITNMDLFCLNESEFLNDVILDFYLKYLFLEKLSEADRARTHIFSSFFFKRLTLRSSPGSVDPQEKLMTPAQRRHNRVRTWTRHVDLFEKDFIFIPINEKAHWMMAVVCFPGLMAQQQYNYQAASPAITEEVGQSGDAPPPVNTQGGTEDEASQDSQPDSTTSSTKSKANSALGRVVSADEAKAKKGIVNVGLKQACILIMDSLSGPNRTNIVRHLKDYLQVEWGLKKTPQRDMLKTIRGCQPKVPQQSNYSDCGLFVLQYAESFFENPIANFSIPMKLGDWFPRNRVDRKREEIRNLILRLQAEYNR